MTTGDYEIMDSDIAARAIFCAKKNTMNLFRERVDVDALDAAGDVAIPEVGEEAESDEQTISFTQEAFDKRARQLIEAIQQNHDAYRNNIVVLANVGMRTRPLCSLRST